MKYLLVAHSRGLYLRKLYFLAYRPVETFVTSSIGSFTRRHGLAVTDIAGIQSGQNVFTGKCNSVKITSGSLEQSETSCDPLRQYQLCDEDGIHPQDVSDTSASQRPRLASQGISDTTTTLKALTSLYTVQTVALRGKYLSDYFSNRSVCKKLRINPVT